MFQFLMVQLKASVEVTIHTQCGVSIPYGSIKSMLTENIFRFSLSVSIPYGSIKSTIQRTGKKHQSRFNSLWFN